MKRISIAAYVLIIALLSFVVSGGVLSAILDKNLKALIDREALNIASARMNAVIGVLQTKYDRLKLTQNIEAYEKAFQGMAVKELEQYLYGGDGSGRVFFILDTEGKAVMHPEDKKGEKILEGHGAERLIFSAESGEIDKHMHGKDLCWSYFREFKPWQWKVIYCIPYKEKYASLNSIRASFISAGMACLLFAVFVITISVYLIIKPINKLAEATAAMAEGDLDRSLPKGGIGEIASLSENFSSMRDNIKKTITELKESNEDLESFAYASSHDLKEPLRNITNYAQLLKKRSEKKLDEESRNFMDEIIYSIERMDSLIRGILAYSRAGRTENAKGEADIAAMLTQIKNDAAIMGGAELEFEGSEMPVIRGDKAALTSVLQNLIMNGLKFNRSAAPKVSVTSALHGSEWVFEVTDNGIGIEKEYREKIFEVFQRLHSASEFSGSGIGLSVCRKIIMRHGGRIWAEERKDGMNGTVIKFTLPA